MGLVVAELACTHIVVVVVEAEDNRDQEAAVAGLACKRTWVVAVALVGSNRIECLHSFGVLLGQLGPKEQFLAWETFFGKRTKIN